MKYDLLVTKFMTVVVPSKRYHSPQRPAVTTTILIVVFAVAAAVAEIVVAAVVAAAAAEAEAAGDTAVEASVDAVAVGTTIHHQLFRCYSFRSSKSIGC